MVQKIRDKIDELFGRNLIPIGSFVVRWHTTKDVTIGYSSYLYFRTRSGKRVCKMSGRSPKQTTHYFQVTVPWLNGVIGDNELDLQTTFKTPAPVLQLVKS